MKSRLILFFGVMLSMFVGSSIYGQACTLTPPANVTVSTDATICAATVTGLVATASAACAATVNITAQDFTSCTQPAGWTVTQNTTLAGGTPAPGCQTFTFAGAGNTDCGTPPPSMAGCRFEMSDDDAGSSAPAGVTCLVSPVINNLGGGAYTGQTVSYSWTHRVLGHNFVVDYSTNGTTWTNIATETTTNSSSANGAPDPDKVNVPASATLQVRWCLDDSGVASWGWGAAVDNITFSAVDPSLVVITNNSPYATSNGANASGVYPKGVTTITYTTTNAAGQLVTATSTVTVVDQTPPALTCPSNSIISLDAGECNASYYYTVEAVDNCPSTPFNVVGPVCDPCSAGWVTSDALACGVLHSSIQEITIPALTGMNSVTGVCFGQNFVGFSGSPALTVNVFAGVAGNIKYIENGDVPIATQNYTLSSANDGSCVCLNFTTPGVIPPGTTTLYVEFRKMSFGIGTSNGCGAAGGTKSFLQSVACGVPTPTSYAALGFAFVGDIAASVNIQPSAIVAVPGAGNLGTFDAPNGEASLPIGVNCFNFSATDAAGNASTCSWCVEVKEFPEALQTKTLACNDHINVSVDGGCDATITPDMVLEGGPYGCYETYNVTVTGVPAAAVSGNGTNAVTIDATKIAAFVANGMAGPYQISISDPDNNNNSCWGTFMLEDKLPPVIECHDVTITCIDPTAPTYQTFTGTVSATQTNTGVSVPTGTNGAGTSNTLAVGAPAGAVITDVNVSLDQTHTWINDLDMWIVSPDGTEVQFLDSPCGNNDDILATFDDEATQGFQCTGIPAISGTVKPSHPLSDLDGHVAKGDWYIRWADNVGGDGGPMNSFGVTVSWILEANAAIASDNCTAIVPIYSDSEQTLDCSSGISKIITRQWQATDAKGNKSPVCVQRIAVTPVKIADLNLPPSLVVLTCNSGTEPEDIVNYFDNPLTKDNALTAIIENNEGYPYAYPHYFVNGHPQKVDNNVCSIYATHADQTIAACGAGCNGNKKVIRTWTLLDWCTGELATYVQIIKASDNEAPTYIVKDITVSTAPWYCAADFDVPMPWELHDNCDSNPRWSISGPAGVIITGNPVDGYKVAGAPKGVHTFTYSAVDCCGNVRTQDMTVTVVDKTKPVAVAIQNLVVSLTVGGPNGGGNAKIFPSHIDNGSYDACSPVHLEIRREDGSPACNNLGLVVNPTTGERYNNNVTYDNTKHEHDNDKDTDGGQYVKFCCEDLTDVDASGVPFGMVKVWLRVWDDGDMDGLYGTAGDNYNETWGYVRVEDKSAPALVCPPDVTVTCDMDLNISTTRTTTDGVDMTMTGGPASAYGTCGNIGVDYQDLPQLNSCNIGTITRRFFVAGRNDIFCVQRITVTQLPNSQPWSVTPPSSAIVNAPCDFNQGDIKDSEKPVATGGPCDVIGESITIDTFYFEDGACKKWRVAYEYINWCTGETKGPFFKFYKYEDPTKPVLTDCTDKMIAVDGNCEAVVTLTNTATDEGACQGGWLKWQVFVDLWGDGTYDWEFSTFVSGGTNPADNNNNGIPDIFTAATSSGQAKSITIPGVVAGSMSNHKVLWKVTDGCGNVTSCETGLMVVDKKAPTPYCVSLSSAVMQNGQVELWARDFDKGSFDNCTAKENLLFTFNEMHPVLTKLNVEHYFKGAGLNATEAEYNQGNAQKWVPSYKSSAKIFDCDEVPEVAIKMSVWDEKLNTDYCLVTLTLADNQGACGGSRIAGNLTTTTSEPIANVQVTIDANVDPYPTTATYSGSFGPILVGAGNNYQVSADKTDDYSNGVSTLDLVLIQRHILGLAKLNDPYKLVAADVNNDNKVNASDLVELRKLILGLTAKFSNNSSWEFIPTTETMTVVDPYNYTSDVVITNAEKGANYNSNFYGVKIGDVNGSVVANLNSNAAENRTSNKLTLTAADKAVVAGDVVELNVTAANFKEVFGYQFTANLNGLTLTNVRSGALTIEDSNYGLVSDNTMTMSYAAKEATTLVDGEVLFTMVFKATSNGTLSNMVSLGSSVTKAESYTGTDLEVGGLELSFRTEPGVAVDGYAMFQNEPNPFKAETVVTYNMPEAGAAKFTLYDVTGKVILVKNETAVKGSNTVKFSKSEISASGVVYYQIESGDFTATKKMIIIE